LLFFVKIPLGVLFYVRNVCTVTLFLFIYILE
jgi:hypothetical protein